MNVARGPSEGASLAPTASQSGYSYGTALDSILAGGDLLGGGDQEGEPAQELQGGLGRKIATVTEWSQRGFGFIMCEDGTRAYVHNSACGGEHLEQGEPVEVDIVPDPRTPGKWQALNVVRGEKSECVEGEPTSKRARWELSL